MHEAMPMTKQQILSEAKAMNPREREELIEELRQIGDPDELTPEQRVELHRRMEELRSGAATLIDGDQAMRQLREEFGHR
jgi:hypothetical protein